MAYAVPNPVFQADDWARNKVIAAQQFRDSAIDQYIDAYESFWDLFVDRTDVERQQVLDAMGPAALEILQDGSAYVSALEKDFGDILPELYSSAPFELDYTSEPGRVLIGDMKQEWADLFSVDDDD